MYSPWAIPNDPRIAVANMNAVFPQVETKPKIYLTCFPYEWGNKFRPHHDVVGQALAEDGTGLASHLSSSEDWSRHDMGLTGDWKHDIYDEHYPQGYELIWIDDPHTDPRWQAALALNKAKHEGEE